MNQIEMDQVGQSSISTLSDTLDGAHSRGYNTHAAEPAKREFIASEAIPALIKEELTDCLFTATEWNIVRVLAAHAGEGMASQDIYSLAWRQQVFPEDRKTIKAHVSKIRRTLPGGYSIFLGCDHSYIFDSYTMLENGYIPSFRLAFIERLDPEKQDLVRRYSMYYPSNGSTRQEHVLRSVLSPVETALMDFLVIHYPDIVMFEEFLEEFYPMDKDWQEDAITRLRQHVNNMRKILTTLTTVYSIETIRREGYCLVRAGE